MNTPEAGTGGSAQFRASIEYPAGTFTQVLFSGVATGTAADNTTLISDEVTVSIPEDAQFWVRIWCDASVGIAFLNSGGISPTTSVCANAASGYDLGEALAFAASGISDQTMSGTITATTTSATAPIVCPVAILGYTSRASVYILGDSRAFGAGDTFDSAGDTGEVARSIGGDLGYINAGCYGDRSDNYILSHARRVELAQWCSHIVCEMGINDLRSGSGGNSTAAALETRLQTIYGYFTGTPIYQTTVGPRATSTDSWATTANQTTDSNNAARVTFNDDVRAGLATVEGYFELADCIESARNSGKWKVTGGANGYTTDGLHENRAGYLLVPAANAVPPATFTR